MTKYVGTGMTVAYNSGAWAANYVRSVTIDETARLADTSGASDTARTFAHIIKDGTASITILDDDSNATVVDIFEPLTSSTLTFVKTGVISVAGTAIVTSRSVAVGYEGEALVTVNLQFTGGVTNT